MTFVLTMAEQLTNELDEIIAQVCPGAGRRPMYGGIVFEAEAGNPKTLVCGHFTYKKHVSLEFSNGYQLNDLDNVLEGAGKYRRHVKLTCQSDLHEKSVRALIVQAFEHA